MVEMFPTRMRFSGIAIGYNVAQSLFGGTAPLICTWLIAETADITSPAYFIIALGVVSLIAAFKLKSNYGDNADYN
jgi:MHS family proline/betaine transporter-like MFS transporter